MSRNGGRIVLLVAALLTGGVPGGRMAAQDGASLIISKENRTIAVTATDQVVRPAEIGTVHVGFQVYGASKDEAYAAATRASNAIMQALTATGISKEAIQSESQSVAEAPAYNDRQTPDERKARAFTAQQSWTVRVRADEAAHALDLAVRAGANQSGQIEWSLADPNAAQAEAAAKAIQRARTQAAAMASGMGVKLGELLHASNQVAASPVRPMPMAMRAMGGPMQKELAINPREIETSATVYAVFALE